jgi:hypothetical protein
MSFCVETTRGIIPAGHGVTNRQSHEVQLLAEIQEVCRRALLLRILDLYRQQNVDKLRSAAMVSAELASSAQKLASLLRPMLIRPAQIKFDGGKNWRGYRRHWFEKALIEEAWRS